MPSSSPYQNNDYQAASSFRPYKLPVNDIYKSISMNDKYWEDGARQVKSAYDNALNMSLVTDENRDIRDQYMKEAEKQMTKISSMNLADPSVQKQGVGIFKNLLRDENIVGEDYVVKNLNKEYGIGLSYRTKDGGKEYNPLSVENIQYEKQLLSTGLNKRDGWKSLYQNMSTYSPQVDTAAELKKITDLVKAKEIKDATLQGGEWYIQEITKKGVSKDRLLAAIEDMGSPALKQQMRVEGRNTYYKHLASDPAMTDSYFQGLATNLFDAKVNDLKNQKAEIEYQMYMIPKDSDAGNNAKRNAYDRVITDLTKSIDNLETVEKPKYVNEFTNLSNLDNLSSNVSKVEQLWQSATINELAPKLAWESSSQEIKPNNAKIAKENINVAMQRLSLGYANLAEDKRHNQATEDDAKVGRLLEKLKIDATGSSTANPVFGGGGPDAGTSIASPRVATENETSKASIGEAERTSVLGELQNTNEVLTKSVISNVIGDNAWASIESNKDKTESLAQNGVLTDNDLDKAAAYMKAFSDKYAQSAATMWGGAKVVSNAGKSVEQWKKDIGNMDIRTFKNTMSRMVNHDVEFSADLVAKISKDNNDPNGPLKAANLRTSVNSAAQLQQNISNLVLPQQVTALSDYSKYFDNNGKVALTDQAIAKAYSKGLQDNSLRVYTKRATTGSFMSKSTDPVRLTKAEYENYKSKGKSTALGGSGFTVEENTPSLSEFAQEVRRRTDPIFYQLATENNTQATSFFYSEKNKAGKFRDLQTLPNIVQTNNTDDKTKIEKVLSFIKDRSDKVQGYNLQTPSADETLPTMQLIMSDLSKDDKAEWAKLKDVRLPVIVNDPKWNKKDNAIGKYMNRGAVVSYAGVNNAEKGSISIINASANNDFDAEINVKDVYLISDGKRMEVTSNDIKAMIERKFQAPLNDVIKADPNAVNTLLAIYTTNLEKANKEAKEKK